MITLDEVIDAMERCSIPHYFDCKGCPYNGIGACALERETDALQWLKGYKVHIELDKLRDKYGVTSQKLRNTSQITCPKCHSEFVILPEANNPLTWDELKSMEGKPVWIEDGLENGEWYIIECFTESGRFIAHDRYADDTVFKAIDMGNMWQAYRKERS